MLQKSYYVPLLWLLLALTPNCRCGASLRDINCREMKAVKLATPPDIDGDITDAIWKTVPTSTGFTEGYDGSPAINQTIVQLGYDAKCVYVAFHCLDTDPAGILANQRRKNAGLSNDDHLEFRINPFGTRRSEDESLFGVNLIGTVETTIAGGRADKQEWFGDWRAASKRVADGWTGEMAIPWDIINHPSGGASATLDVNFVRIYPRGKLRSYWSNIGINEQREYTGRWVGVEMPAQAKNSTLSILGYNFSGYNGANGLISHSGLDIRDKLTPQLTLVGTLNPDFANVEGDIQNIDFSYAEKLASERRPFFLEGNGYYSLGYDNVNPFASQRIASFTEGIGLYGKTNPNTSLGMLGAFNGRRSDFALRWKQMLCPTASMTYGLVRRDDDLYTNTVYEAMGGWHNPKWHANYVYARSEDRASSGEWGYLTGGYGTARYDISMKVNQISPGFKARDGYVPYTDYRNVGLSAWYDPQWRHGFFREVDYSVNLSNVTHYDGTFYQRYASAEVDCRSQQDLWLQFSAQKQDFEAYRDHVYVFGVSYPASDSFHNFGLNVTTGRRQNTAYTRLAPTLNYRFGDKLTLGFSADTVTHEGYHEQDIFTLNYDLDRAHSLAGRFVRRNGGTNSYLSYRQSGYGGLEYYVIVGDPNADRFTNRFVFKVVAPLR